MEYYTNGKIKYEGIYNQGKKLFEKGYNIKGKKRYEIKEGKGKIEEYNQ